MNPRARKDGLLIRELGGELLVYDLERHRAHCLNPTAAVVFKHCDGRTSVARMARDLRHATGAPADERWVWLALDRLAKANLLQGELVVPAALGGLSRRDLMRRAGQVAGLTLLLPAVTSIIAPTPAEAAATCVANCAGQLFGTPCKNSNPSDCGVVCICNGSGSCTQFDGVTPCP